MHFIDSKMHVFHIFKISKAGMSYKLVLCHSMLDSFFFFLLFREGHKGLIKKMNGREFNEESIGGPLTMGLGYRIQRKEAPSTGTGPSCPGPERGRGGTAYWNLVELHLGEGGPYRSCGC